jgi:predicted nucleotidyltransferase
MIFSMISSSQDVLRAVGETLEESGRVLLAIVYGSAATGAMRSDSDVDVALLGRDALTAEEKLSLSQVLFERLEREVDVVDLRTVNGVLLKQILTKGKVVLKRDEAAYAALLKRMIYNQEDYMPYYRRALRERMDRFVNGQRAD